MAKPAGMTTSALDLNMNENLSICIPTFNRAEVLRSSLAHLIPLVSRYDIPIYISDNASPDATAQVIAEAQDRYPHIFSHRNSENVGMDKNFEVALNLPSTRYTWIVGDDDRINPDAVGAVLNIVCASDCQLVLLNGGSPDTDGGRVRAAFPQVYTQAAALLHDLGWHSTWISGLVLSRALIKDMQFGPYIGSAFSHFGSLYTALARHKTIDARWKSESCFCPSSAASFTWASQVFEIFSEKWAAVVQSLPEHYQADIKRHCIREHSVHTGIFSVKGLLNLRAQGVISRSLVRQYAATLKLTSQTNLHLATLIASLPVWLLRGPRRAFVMLRNGMRMRQFRAQNGPHSVR